VYNEQLRDLLYGEAGDPPKLSIMHDDAWGTVVNNVSTYEVTSMEQINLLMARAAKQRAVGFTDVCAPAPLPPPPPPPPCVCAPVSHSARPPPAGTPPRRARTRSLRST